MHETVIITQRVRENSCITEGGVQDKRDIGVIAGFNTVYVIVVVTVRISQDDLQRIVDAVHVRIAKKNFSMHVLER